jgi:hypothetical protein
MESYVYGQDLLFYAFAFRHFSKRSKMLLVMPIIFLLSGDF